MQDKIGSQKLGEALIQQGFITKAQLEEALSLAKNTTDKKLLIGEAIVELGYCTEKQIARTMAHKSKAKFASLNDMKINLPRKHMD